MTAPHRTDKAILDWLGENMNELSVTRDVTDGARFTIDYCAASTGCAVELEGRSLRGLVERAMMLDDPGTLANIFGAEDDLERL